MSKSRKIFFTICLGIWLVNICTAASSETPKGKRPNILVIIADDCTYRDLPAYGGQNVEMPNLDRLASQSLTFNKAYVSMSMCTPSRSEFFTGLYPARSGVCWNHGRARSGTKSIVHYLGDVGYRTGIAGKIHVFPDEVFPFEKVGGLERNCVSETAEFDPKGMIDFMSESDDPFCLISALVVPHIPWTVGDPSHFDPASLKLPPYVADTEETRKDYAKYLAEIEVLDYQVGETLKALEASGKADNTIVIFTSEQGSQLPFCKWTNWDMGVHTGFMVRWPGVTKEGARTDALIQYNDVLPTLLEAVGSKQKYDFDGSSFISVLKGEKTEHRDYAFFMHNNIPEGPAYPIRSVTDGTYHYIHNLNSEELYIEKHLMANMPINSYWSSWVFETSADERTRQLVNRYMKRPEMELYDLSADSFEENNLAGNDEYAAVLNKLQGKLKAWMTSQSDPGEALDSWKAFRNAKKGTHFQIDR